MKLSLILCCLVWSADIPLEPLVRACNGSTLVLSNGTYSGLLIDPKATSTGSLLIGRENSNIVVLKSSSDHNPLFDASQVGLCFFRLSIIAPKDSPFIVMHSSEGVVFQQVHHLYTVLTCPLVELHNGGAALRTNTFENGSRFACSLFDFKNGSQDEYRKVMEVQDSIFSGITMTAATPLLACGHIRRIEDLNNTYEMIKFAISPSTQSNLGSALSATPLRSVMTGANITECDGPLNGGIFFFLQCAEATFTDVTVIQCTNVVSGLVFTPDEVTHISVIKSTFWSCTTTRDTPHGSALFINHSATLSVSLATFTNNTASNCGGAIYVSARCQWVNITSSSFLNNQAPYGGAIGVGGKPTAAEGGWVIQQCQFANVGRSGTDVYFDDMSALGLTERAFAGCVSRSKSPRVFDFKSRTGYDWTNRQ